MRLLMLACALVCALVCAGSANADHICTNSPNEVHVGNAPDPQGNPTVPICRWNEAATQQAAPPQETIVRERWQVWEDRYGAIALDASSGIYGVSKDTRTEDEAGDAARKVCVERGGEGCAILTRVKNGCVTFAWGGGYSAGSSDRDSISSERSALDHCETQSGTTCKIIETSCSAAVSYWSDTKPANFVPAD